MNYQIRIENLKCGGCAATIKKGISSIDGVSDVNVDLETSVVEVVSEKDTISEIKAKLSKMGYPEVGEKNTLGHKAKSFVSCAVGRLDS